MGCVSSKEGYGDRRDRSSDVRSNRSWNYLVRCFFPRHDDISELGSVERSSVRGYDNFVSSCSSDSNDHGAAFKVALEENPKIPVFPGNEAECIVAGWPSWLAAAAGDALYGWKPRRLDAFRQICKIGDGTYGSVFKCMDLETSRVVALKKVTIGHSDPGDRSFVAREIRTLRRLDHPNVVKLEGVVASQTPTELLLIFEFMEYDLANLMESARFSESQVRFLMRQILGGLDHCHRRGVLHRDIKGSNILVDKKCFVKIIDFGLSKLFDPDKNQRFTDNVITLRYRPPELLLGATEYGPAVDLWSVGCIFGELLSGKPILTGKTAVEQLDKIFTLCGTPPEDYWKRSKLPRPSAFKSRRNSRKNRIHKEFGNFSDSAVALLQVLLSVDPNRRGSAASALRSDFFT